MVKFFLILLLMILTLSADEKEDNIYEANCIKCHSKLPVSIDKYFKASSLSLICM